MQKNHIKMVLAEMAFLMSNFDAFVNHQIS